MAQSADIQYVNVEVLGPAYGEPESFRVASYDVTRLAPLLDNPEDYYMSVVRASIDNATCPLFVCPLVPGSSTITPWEISIVTSVGAYTQSLLWQTQIYSSTAGDPIADWPQFCWSVETLVSMLNLALAAAFSAFAAAEPLAPQSSHPAPSFFFDSDTGRFSLVAEEHWATAPPGVWPLQAGEARVGWNNALLSRLDGFHMLSVPGPAQNVLVFEKTANSLFDPVGSLYFVTQTYDCNSILSSVSSYVITTSSLPVVREAVAPTTTLGVQQPNNPNPAVSGILCDFVPQVSRIADLRASGVYYTPSGEYRLISLTSSRPLYRVSISFQWRSRDGRLYPVVLSNNGRAECKLMFVRKSTRTLH